MRSPLRHDRRRPSARTRATAALCVALVSIAACERTSKSNSDSTVTPSPAASDTSDVAATNAGWNAEAGSILLVAGDVPGLGEVIFPEVTDSSFGDSALMDLAPVRGAQVTLFSRRGEVANATIIAEDTTAEADSSDDACEDWPLVRLRNESRGPTAAWTIGLMTGHAHSMPLDSMDHLPRADSIRLATDVVHLAQGLPDDTARAFRGLPFYVRSVRRFHPAPGIDALVADVSRRINQEADPREEQLLLIAERDSGKANSPWHASFNERASGHEGTVETHDVLAGVTVGAARRPTLVLAHYIGDGVAYALLERNGAGRWERRWVSAASGCTQ
jgi:hypothetical protein